MNCHAEGAFCAPEGPREVIIAAIPYQGIFLKNFTRLERGIFGSDCCGLIAVR